ncbi:MAG: peptide ABC transporter permease [Bdellovibrionaceae bacterium]|nr:peptide ABC transporter permease [Pseudobdellovibrionaceae bacterium]|tara:strand:- start:947 stop:1768 length:822 start_codon:yes stop_codon:yes gene_type:complete
MRSLPKIFVTAGSLVIGLLIAVALFAPLLASQSPNTMNLENRLVSPSKDHLFGTDENGSDVFSKVVYGARVSLLVAGSVVLISAFVGLIIGSIAGFKGGWIDLSLMRAIDIVYAFPGFLLALSLVAVLGPSLRNLIIAMSLTGWASFARLVRGEVLYLKEKEYVVCSRSLGSGALRQIVFHIWPNLLGLLFVQATFAMAGTIISESGLSFLGLGVPSTTPSWGALLNSGRRVLFDAPHVSLFPGLAIMTLVLGFNLLGDGLRDLFDPRRQLKG